RCSQTVTPSPAQPVASAVHQAPHGRWASVTETSVVLCKTGVAAAAPYAIRLPWTRPQTEVGMGLPAVSALSSSATGSPDSGGAGWSGPVILRPAVASAS